MIICLEGPDGAGKSTLADSLSQYLGGPNHAPIIKRGPLTRNPLDEYELDLWRVSEFENVILDRWHVGELVYGPLLRGESKLTSAMNRHVELLMDRLGVARVVLSPPLDVLQRLLKARGDDLVSVAQLPALKRFYDDYAAREGWFHPDQSDYHLVQNVITLGLTLERATAGLKPFTTYVGPPRPTVLFLGEERSNDQYPSAFVPELNTSGHYLLTAFEEVGLKSRYGMANALEEDVFALWRTLGQPKVIALGSKAKRAARAERIPSEGVPHPQYVRRFHHDGFRVYAQGIKEIADA